MALDPRDDQPRRILLAGASGMIGTPLVALLRERGHSVHTLVRRAPTDPTEHEWHPEVGEIRSGIVDHVDTVVNLSGASIGKIPWTKAHKDRILRSRISATKTLVEAISRSATPPSLLVQGSAVGFYGDRGEDTLTEQSERGEGFLADVVVAWEEEARPADSAQTRVAFARTGLVIGKGGAMAPLKLQTQLGLGGRIGSGLQWWPWISLRDEVRALAHVIQHESDFMVFNLVGPEPARSRDITLTLARALRRPHLIGLPEFAIDLALGEAGRELLLPSQRIVSNSLTITGFTWEDTTVSQAIEQMLQRGR